MPTTIRKTITYDIDTLVEFNRAIAKETENRTLDVATLAAGVRAVFDDPSRGFYLIAENDGKAVGSLLITSEWSDWRNGYFWWIQSVYVHPDFRGKGVYKTLYRHVEDMAKKAAEVCGLRLYVDRDNSAARNVYSRLGMAHTQYELYETDDLKTSNESEDG